jgi:hypothetical protein
MRTCVVEQPSRRSPGPARRSRPGQRTDPRHDHGMSSALSPVSRRAATVRSAWRRPARTVADCPRSESLPAAGASQGSVRKQRCVGAQTIPACRQQHISAEESCSGRRQKHITELARLRGDPQCHAQDVWTGAGKPRDREKRTATWSVPASSSQPTPVLPTAPRRPFIPSQDLTSRMQRFPAAGLAEQEKRPPRALPTNVASISPRHLSGFVTSQLLRGAWLCRSRPARKGRSFEGVSRFTGCFPPPPHPARSSDIRPNSTGMG